MDSVVDGNVSGCGPKAERDNVHNTPTDLMTQTVYDATDGAIVIFGSPGSEVKNNRVISRTRMIMGGKSEDQHRGGASLMLEFHDRYQFGRYRSMGWRLYSYQGTS
jgi:hypothetical protein